MNDDTISRRVAIDALDALCDRECEYSKQQRSFMCGACRLGSAFDVIDELPSVQPERMTNRQWVDFLSAQFDISRTSAKEMLHGMMRWKKEDNFKKLFNGGQK